MSSRMPIECENISKNLFDPYMDSTVVRLHVSVKAMKRYSTLFKAAEQEPHYQI